MSELKPCPFCGGEAKHFGGAGYHCIRCTSCGITNERLVIGSGYYQAYDSYTEAAEAWNRRATDGD